MQALDDERRDAERKGKLALISLLCGIAFCVPPAAIAALVFGFVALRSRNPQRGGNAAAWAGILFACLGFVLIGYFVYSSYGLASPARNFCEDFIQDLSAGHLEAAASKCDVDVTRSELELWEQKVQALGTPVRIECTLPLVQPGHFGRGRRWTYTIDAQVSSPNGKSRTFSFGLLRVNGNFRVSILR